jgi:microcystin-dependent protein
MKEAVATRLTSTYFGGDSTAMGAAGGSQSDTLITANLPPYTPAGTIANGAITVVPTHGGAFVGTTNNNGPLVGGGNLGYNDGATATQAASTFTGTAQGGTSTPIRTVQPTIVCNYIIRII